MIRCIACVMLVLGLMVPARAAAPPSATQYYENAIEATRHMTQSEFAAYDVHLQSTGLAFSGLTIKDGKATFNLTLSRRDAVSDASFAAAYRKSDDLTSVQTPQGWGTIRFPMFDPTWSGIEDWIRYGVFDPPASAAAAPAPSPGAPAKGLRVIGDVRAMGVAFYNVSDAGSASCANGNPGHRLHLIARRDALRHPMTDAIVDQRTGRLCYVRFEIRQSVIAAGFTCIIELNLAEVDGETLVRHANIDFVARAFGFGIKHAAIRLTYDRFTFPKTLASDVFPGSS